MAEKNVLEQFATFNSLFSLSCATPGEVNSQSYRSANPLPRIILSSAGRFDGQRVQTAYGAPEYYIDNVSIDCSIAPTPTKGNGPWSKLSFDVYEPYSMGLFLQSCQAAALEAGFKSYLDNAAYVFRIEFKGWAGPNQPLEFGPYNWLVRLKKIDFTVNESGSTYKVECFPYNHIALSDQMNIIMNDVRLVGKTANEALIDHPDYSLVQYLNNREQQLVADGKKTYPDVFKIEFVGDNPFGRAPGNDLEFKPDSQGGMSVQKREGDVREGDKVIRGKMSINPKEKTLQFSQGMSITNMIDNIVLSTREARENATDESKLDAEGRVTWWKLDIDVKLLEPLDPKTKDFPKEVTYRIQVFKVHHSTYLHPEGTSRGVAICKSKAQKEYNYIYTGKNTDILKFNIEVKNMMFTAIDPNKAEDTQVQAAAGINRRVESLPDVSKQPSGAAPPSTGGNAPSAKQDLRVGNLPFKGGSGDLTTKQKIANEFYMAYLNSVGNQINLDLEILGDPFWLPELGLSNYHGSGDNQISGNNTMNHEATDIYCVVNFRTPVDPDSGGSANKEAGLYYFPDGDAPSPFSGLFKVIKCESNWKNGMFSQTLRGFRFPAQDVAGGPAFATEPDVPETDTGQIYDLPGVEGP